VSADHGRWPFFDKDTLPLKRLDVARRRADRAGRVLGPRRRLRRPRRHLHAADVRQHRRLGRRGDTLIDSHALVGSCAQVGARVHVSAGAQIGGVIEPVGAMPVIVEDEVLVGGNTGLYEGAVVKARAVIAAGTMLTGSTPIYDLPHERVIRPEAGSRSSCPRARSWCPARAR
jgi:2,3,4,5-tetrahydropyridine-2,6-dicarboxylate N-succinyltransferase